jgi:hypothetical protein
MGMKRSNCYKLNGEKLVDTGIRLEHLFKGLQLKLTVLKEDNFQCTNVNFLWRHYNVQRANESISNTCYNMGRVQ